MGLTGLEDIDLKALPLAFSYRLWAASFCFSSCFALYSGDFAF
jgi:hypothetical protein